MVEGSLAYVRKFYMSSLHTHTQALSLSFFVAHTHMGAHIKIVYCFCEKRDSNHMGNKHVCGGCVPLRIQSAFCALCDCACLSVC